MLKRSLILLFLFIILPLQVAFADCKTLATKFAQNPNSLNVDELAELRECVNNKLREKLEVPRLIPGCGLTPPSKNTPPSPPPPVFVPPQQPAK
jgi:hypothetical protein